MVHHVSRSTGRRFESRLGAATAFVFSSALIVCGVVGCGGSMGGMFGNSGSNSTAGSTTHVVQREQLLVTVAEDGNLESAQNVDVKCEVAGGSTILSIIADGTLVQAGQDLVQLDASTLEENLRSQKGIYEKALAAKIQADEDAGAAEIAVQEYIEGTFLKEMQLVEAQIKIAMENLRSAENVLEHSGRMARKGFVTPLQVEADQFAVERAKLDLSSAEIAKSVLEKFTRAKMLKELEAKRDAAKARARSEKATVDLEKGKLDKLENQLAKCVIKAPAAGMVVYYKENSRWGSSNQQIAEGSPVREHQTIIQLPDLTKMQARVPIHESKVELVRPGMRAYLKVLDKEFQGTVIMIANQPESKSFFQAQVKEYPAVVRIDGDASGLRPGMTAEVEILIADLKDVLTVPVAAVVELAGRHFAWVQKNGELERRPLVLGQTNDKMVEVKDGVIEGEAVVLNPRAVVAEARAETKSENDDSVDTKKKFGEVAPVEPGRPSGPTGAAGGGPTAGGPTAGGQSGGRRGGPLKVADLDTDKDGKLSKDEAPEQMKQFFDRMDTDMDGFVTQSEATASYQRMQRQRQQQQEGGVPGGGPPGGGLPAGGQAVGGASGGGS